MANHFTMVPVCSSLCRWRGGELHTRLVLSTESFRILGVQSPLYFQGLAYDRPTGAIEISEESSGGRVTLIRQQWMDSLIFKDTEG